MLAVPPVLLKLLQAGAMVAVAVEGDRLIAKPRRKTLYALEELLAASDYTQPQPPEEREWVDAPAVGGELCAAQFFTSPPPGRAATGAG